MMDADAVVAENCDIPMQRPIEEIEGILQLAKLSSDDLFSTSQVIRFTSENLHNNDYKLLELDSHLLQRLENGDSLYFKGASDDSVVICSDTRTYDVVETETSNSLLLAENLKFKTNLSNATDTVKRCVSNVTISGIFYEYLEPIASRPYSQKLNEILKRTVYKGPEYEFEINVNELVTYEDLLNNIQASEAELNQALEVVHAFKLDNKLRILDFEYHFKMLSYMLKLIEENSWNLDDIDYDETSNALSDLIPVVVLDTLFDMYTEKSKVVDGLQLYRYKEAEVCAFFAQVLLSHAGKFNFTEFIQAWSESVPEGMQPSEEMLYGIAIVDKTSIPHVIRTFTEDKLSDNVHERFKVLFEAKEKWTVPEITPYIRGLTTDKMDVSALLAKYARASTVGGIKYYSAKHAK